MTINIKNFDTFAINEDINDPYGEESEDITPEKKLFHQIFGDIPIKNKSKDLEYLKYRSEKDKLIDKCINMVIEDPCNYSDWLEDILRTRFEGDTIQGLKNFVGESYNKNRKSNLSKLNEDIHSKEELIEIIEGWIRSIEQQEDWLNARIFAKEEMRKFVEELKNYY